MNPRALAVAIAVLTVTAGCATWRPQTVPPQWVIERQHPNAVLVTRRDGTSVELKTPRMAGDTVVGTVRGQPVAVPAADIATIAVWRTHGGRTAGLVFASGVGALVGLAALIAVTWD